MRINGERDAALERVIFEFSFAGNIWNEAINSWQGFDAVAMFYQHESDRMHVHQRFMEHFIGYIAVET